MTRSLISTNPQEIERLPAGGLAGFCCEDRNCPDCLRAYRRGLAFMRQERVARAGQIAPRKLRQSRKPTLASLLQQAAKAGKSVRGAEVYPDRTVLQFGEPTTNESDNPWDVAAATLRQKKELPQ
jgi:hypothetical protein